MNDQVLITALEKYDNWNTGRTSEPVGMMTTQILAEAARERLAQLPENCGTCSGNSKVFARNPYAPTYVDGTHLDDCPTCHGSGKVYSAELVERIARLMVPNWGPLDKAVAVAVLDALNA